MSPMSLSEMLTYSTVLIHCEYKNGTRGSGTGFIMNLCQNNETNEFVPVLITNNHVVQNSVKTEFEFCKKDESGNPLDTESVRFRYEGANWIHHPDKSVDLRCLPLAPALNDLGRNNVKIFYIPLGTDIIPEKEVVCELSAMEDVVMIGYPIGLSDHYNHKPIIRRGITATHPKKDYQGKKEILVDMACFPGSSGSPVFILNQGTYTTKDGIAVGNRIMLLGVLYGGQQYSAEGVLSFGNLPNSAKPIVQIPTNLGVMIKSERLLEFESIFKGGKNHG